MQILKVLFMKHLLNNKADRKGEFMSFSEDFAWGAASASYQVEGAAREDGKGLNIWDVFSAEDGKIYEGHNGDIACDAYHRINEDIQVMKKMGLKAYRFSVSWSRILPEGTGKINEKGLEYYDRLINSLLENNIQPYLTLYHWDLPYELHRQGGWLNPKSPEWFYEYARIIGERFSDRVTNFFTINEQQCAGGLGYYTGTHAPGLKLGPKDFFSVWHNLLKAHGRAVQALRETAHRTVKIGMAPCGALYMPETNFKEDIEAARKATFSIPENTVDACIWDVAMCADPVFLGHYPEDIQRKFGHYFPKITQEDMKLISQPLDIYGQNMYNAVTVRAGENGEPVRVKRYDGFPQTALGWPVTPECMYWAPKFLYERYQKPVIITENGMASHDWVSVDGQVHDSSRVDFMKRYLYELKRGVEEGTDVRGYFAWALMDNFEWTLGYSARFGLAFTDFQTQQRIVKDSGKYYREVIASNGGILKKV